MRTDRMGDVILTTPLARAMKRVHADWSVSFLVKEDLAPLVHCFPDIDGVLSVSPAGRFSALVGDIRKGGFDIAVIVSPTARDAAAVFLAGVPLRIGTRYRLCSPLFNKRVSLHRKYSERHEAEYNFDLVEPLGVGHEGEEPRLVVPEDATGRIRSLLETEGIAPGRTRLVAVHPGSGGSSASWPPDRFASLARLVGERDGMRVVLTGSEGERALVDRVVEGAVGDPLRLEGRLDLVGLAALYSECDLLVSNSTGPLHLAMAAGTPVVGLYCNLRGCTPIRWGPYGRTPFEVLTPGEEICGTCIDGKGKGECMEGIEPETVLASVLRLLKIEEGGGS